MPFEEMLRNRIKNSAHMSKEKDLLRLVLGTVQQKSTNGIITDELCFSVVKSMLGTNNQILFGNSEKKPLFPEGDNRRISYEEESVILKSLLPECMSEQEIESNLIGSSVIDSIRSAKSEGQAIGVAMKHFKSCGAQVEGDVVKGVVQKLRS